MTTAAAVTRQLHQPIISHRSSSSLQIIPHINSLLQTLNPQNPKTHQNPDTSILNHFSPHLTHELVIQLIKNQANPYHSLFFFNWASTPTPNRNHYRHSHFCYIAITDKLLSHKLFSLAADLLKTHKKFSDFMVGKFIKAHGDLGHLRWALKLFLDQVKEGDCLFSCNALLGVLVRANLVGYAWGYFGKCVVKTRIVEPDVSTYTTMIKGLCKVGMVGDAEKLFEGMSCGRNLVTYNVVIDGFCKKGLVEKARGVLDEMVRGGGTCSPDVVSYTTLIDGYCKKGEFLEAMRCFDEMVSENCEPNVLTYNVLINGLCLNGRVDKARRMMSRMRLSGVKDNVATHTSLLKGYCVAGRSDEAIRHFREMVNHGMSLDGKSYAVIVNEYCKLGRPDEGVVLLREMRGRGIKPSLASFNAVLRSYMQLEEFDKAILLLKQMPRMGCHPNFLSYSEVIVGLLGANGRMQDVDMLVSDMILDGHRLDTTLYNSLINAYCVNGDISKAHCLLREIIGEKILISSDCFRIFVKEMCLSGSVHEMESLFDQMRKSYPVSDVETYQAVLNECRYGNGNS